MLKIFEECRRLCRFSRKVVLYSSTYFCILKTWAIISNLLRLDLGFWEASKLFYREVKYREKVFEEFQHLPGFPRKMVLYSSTNLRILKPWVIISNFIRFDLGFWQASKSFYRKLKYKQKVFEEFQCLPGFPRKMVLYLWTYLCILKPWAIISNLVRLDLDFGQAEKPFYRKVKYREKILEDSLRLCGFPRNMVLYSSTNVHILKPGAIISNLIRFDIGFWEAWKQFYRKLKYREKVLEEFQRLSRFPRKMILYASTNFHILEPWAIISNLIRFHLGFWQSSKHFYSKLKYREKVMQELQR